MSDTYKLGFRGEVLEGQHPAVVRTAADTAELQMSSRSSVTPALKDVQSGLFAAARAERTRGRDVAAEVHRVGMPELGWVT